MRGCAYRPSVHQAVGITSKRVTVLSACFCDLHVKTRAMTPEEAASLYKSVLAAVTQIVHREKGHVQSFNGDRFTITFNAQRPCSQQQHHACFMATRLAQVLPVRS